MTNDSCDCLWGKMPYMATPVVENEKLYCGRCGGRLDLLAAVVSLIKEVNRLREDVGPVGAEE